MGNAELVAKVKAELVARGVNLSGTCGAFEITKRVAWADRANGAGLLAKPDGTNCGGYAADIVMYPSGQIVDMLRDSGGANGEQWNDDGVVDPSRYRAAIDPGDVPAAPTNPDPLPAPVPVTDHIVLLAAIDALGVKLEALRAQADANTAKLQGQIDQVVKNAEVSARTIGAALAPTLPGLIGLFTKP